MKLSNKEKFLLYILGVIVLGYTYYEGVYLNLGNKLKLKESEKTKLEDTYNTAMSTIASLEEKKEDKLLLSDKINDMTSIYYPTISQEHIILELNELMEKSGLTGQYKFNKIEVKSIENMEKKQDNLKESSITKISDNYKRVNNDNIHIANSNDNSKTNSTSSEEDSKVSSDTKENTGANADSTNSSNGNTSDSASTESNEVTKYDPSQEKSDTTIEQLKCDLSFEGSYEQLDKFLNLLKENERKIIATNINVGQKSIDKVSGTMSIEFYAVPKLDDEMHEYLEWEKDNESGKDNPFSGASISGDKKDKDVSDFNISVRSSSSVLPSITIGKASDDYKNTYVYSNKNDEESAEISITKKNNKYYYKYKTSKERYPNNYNSIGKEFVPSSDNVVINVFSEGREGNDDKSSLNLKIINDTDLLAQVNVKDDDKKNPRVTIDGDGNNISVNNEK